MLLEGNAQLSVTVKDRQTTKTIVVAINIYTVTSTNCFPKKAIQMINLLYSNHDELDYIKIQSSNLSLNLTRPLFQTKEN